MTEHELSPEQSECIDEIVTWYSDPKSSQVFRVDGNAGTGKTFMVKHAVRRLALETVLFAAFTGKAALVMQQQGCDPSSTIHKLIYRPAGGGKPPSLASKESALEQLQRVHVQGTPWSSEMEKLSQDIEILRKGAGSPIFNLNPDSPVRDADLVVIDEMSMVGEDLAKDLLSFGVKVLVLGDPGQLPPVFGEGYFMRGDADFTLTQIHRQAEGSPIIKLATIARKGGQLVPGQYGDSSVITRSQLRPSDALECDQILCGRNKTRHINNARMRALRGFSGEIPNKGEKLVCLRNNHEKGLLNGSLWTVVRANKFGKYKLSLTVVPEEGGAEITVLAHAPYFRMYGHTDQDYTDERGKTKSWWEQLTAEEQSVKFDIKEAETFTYGYVLTVHKSQGSQWNNVLVLDESWSFGSDARKHLYTAITRAAKRVTVVDMR